MKTYREFINEVATQSTIIPKLDLGTPQTQLSKPVTRPSLMQQAQDLRAMRLRAIERQGGREDEAQRLRAQLSSAEQKASDNRAAELAKLRQGERDQTIARSQNPVRNGTNSNTANNNNTRRDDTRIAQANTVGGADVRRGYLPKPTGGIQGYTGIDRDKLNQAMDAETNRLNDLNRRRTDMETRNQQNPPPPKPQTPTQTQTQTPSTTQEPKGKSWWQQKWEEIFGNSETKTQEPKTQEPKTQEPSNQPTQPPQPAQPSGSLTAEQQKRMDDAWNNRGTVGKQVEEYYNTLSDEDKRRFREYSKSKGYNWQFY